MSGMTSGVVCGTIQATGQSVCYSDLNICLYDQRTTSFAPNFGDSGSPIYWSNTAKGIMSGGSFDQNNNPVPPGYYTFIPNALQDLNMNGVVTR